MCVCARVDLSESLEWILCCLDVSSVVSSLSRCFVLSQAPQDNMSQNLCVSARVDLSESLEWVLCCCQQPVEMFRLKSGTPR